MAASSAPLPKLDFEELLSRDYRPARVTQLQIPQQEGYKPVDAAKHKKKGAAITISNGHNEPPLQQQQQQQQLEETSRLVLSLVSQTPAFCQHLPEPQRQRQAAGSARLLTGGQPSQTTTATTPIPSAFHPVALGGWEKDIDWEGVKAPAAVTDDDDSKTKRKNDRATAPDDPLALLKRPRNVHLDNLDFDNTVDWEGTGNGNGKNMPPLLLELGVAGQSVARHVYQNTVLSAQRPPPALKSDAYRDRVERDWSAPITSTAEVSTRGTLHADKEKMQAFIEARQKKRLEMAQAKTSRVMDAMGTIAMGGGKGRTITSSLMGPGGTERTGRPSRQMTSSMAHDAEYIEQLDLVNNHGLVRDLSKVALREYHRPKLRLGVVRPDLSWQFQIRYVPGAVKKADTSGIQTSSYQAVVAGTHAGEVSKAKLRTEADLSPTEGKLVLMEYCEERPPIQMTKGMAHKIVNYYRGDKAHCPVSAGGGDRPARRKRAGETEGTNVVSSGGTGKLERPPRLKGPNDRPTTIVDWVGKLPRKSKKDSTENKETIDIIPEGVTEVLHPKVHGPFLGEVEEGTTVSGLISNLFVAPIFRHEPESTDFLMILTAPGGHARPGERESMGVVLREFPSSVFTVGQTEPRIRVYAPGTQGEKNFVGPLVSYQIAKALTRTQSRDGHGLRFDELQDRVVPNLELAANALRQRLKQVAVYDKNTMIWTTKVIGFEDYPGLDALGKAISPEGVAAFEMTCAASRRLTDLGIHHLFSGSHTVASVQVTMIYLAGQLNAARELSRKAKKQMEISRSNKTIKTVQATFYEKAAAELDGYFKMLRQKHEIAKYIYEELQLAPWHLTGEFIEVHKKGEGTGMMKLTGLGDPSGQGEGFSFLREADSKPSKSVGSGALQAQVKKITGTEDDLRKLTMKQMAALLRSYGMAQKQIDTLKRWDRVHVIRDLSTKAASDGIGDGLERFARGEKMKLSEQKQMYRERVQVIWRREIAALSADGGDRTGAGTADGAVSTTDGETDTATAQAASTKATSEKGKNDDSDSDSSMDDLAAELEDEMMVGAEANQLVAAHAREQEKESEAALGQLRAAAQDQDLSKDARELAALKRQREEERAAQIGLKANQPRDDASTMAAPNRKVIRRRVTKTHPDGRQTTTFQYILHPEEVGKILAKLAQKGDVEKPRTKEVKYERGADEKPPGHAMFEDEDDFDYSSKGRHHSNKRRGGRRRAGTAAQARGRNLQIGKLKTKISKEERMKKRKREEEELEVYTATAKRKGTSNRRERGSIRDRRAHVIFAEKLEAIRAAVETRPFAGPFVKPVNRRLIPRYYEVISHPIDLSTIRDKISRYEYRTADQMVRDFELMKNNAVKFNGASNPITQEGIAIYEYVRDQVESSRSELTSLEEGAKELLSGSSGKKKKGGKKKSKKSTSPSGGGNVGWAGGIEVNLGDLDRLRGLGSDSDDSYLNL